MMLEPRPTGYDLRFSLLNIPVRVHPLFWLVSIFTANLQSSPAEVAIWIGVVFVSFLVHEFGHALMFRRFGQRPRVILYALGGLATAEPSQDSYVTYYAREMNVRERILVSLAGPAADFLLVLLVIVIINVTRGSFWLERGFPSFWDFRLGIGSPIEYPYLYMLVNDLMWVNIFWGLVNLVPVFPLDGGQVSRELCELHDPLRGLEKAFWISVIAGGIMVVVGLMIFEILIILMFGALAVQNFLFIKQLRGDAGWR